MSTRSMGFERIPMRDLVGKPTLGRGVISEDFATMSVLVGPPIVWMLSW